MFHVKHLLRTYGLELDPEQERLILAHLDFVLKRNEEINLTNITDPEEAIKLHVVDSLLALSDVQAAPEGPLLDMGTGAGYPGLPLAVVTKRESTLLDARAKKIRAVQDFLTAFPEISYCSAVTGRAEELDATVAVVAVRALAQLPSLLELASPLLQQGGRLVALKGRLHPEERERAESLREATGLCEYSHSAYTLPGGEHREVVVYEKIGTAQYNLPRRPGRAQRKPLA
jgi:16S rRNA (guanine527-N7)-methyltransferase